VTGPAPLLISPPAPACARSEVRPNCNVLAPARADTRARARVLRGRIPHPDWEQGHDWRFG
jgi:hypothetical protein